MKQTDLDEIQKIVNQIQQGNGTRRDMIALLILIREHLSKASESMLLDISHCVAHSNRARGLAFDYIEKQIGNFIEIAQRGGLLKVRVLFPIESVIDQLTTSLSRLSIDFKDETLKRQSSLIQSLLIDVLEGVQIELNNKYVTTCRFEKLKTGREDVFSFSTNFTGLEAASVLQIPQKVAIGFPVFSSPSQEQS